MTTRCGYIALLGAPNAGKSTLLNRLVGRKLAIVTPKAQTTRNRITGALIHGQAQLIFVDIPGIFSPPQERRFEQAMVRSAWAAAGEADLLAVIVDARRGMDAAVESLIAGLDPARAGRTFLVLNKIDLVDKPTLLARTAQLNERFKFERTFMVSALTGDGVDALRDEAAARLPEGPFLFPEDHLTDLPQRLLASEITREKLFLLLREELPYALAVETERWEEKPDGSLHIHQQIIVEREGQKGIILGKNGATLKRIGQSAREEIGRLWGVPAHLFLFVKVRPDWKTNPDHFRYLGLPF